MRSLDPKAPWLKREATAQGPRRSHRQNLQTGAAEARRQPQTCTNIIFYFLTSHPELRGRTSLGTSLSSSGFPFATSIGSFFFLIPARSVALARTSHGWRWKVSFSPRPNQCGVSVCFFGGGLDGGGGLSYLIESGGGVIFPAPHLGPPHCADFFSPPATWAGGQYAWTSWKEAGGRTTKDQRAADCGQQKSTFFPIAACSLWYESRRDSHGLFCEEGRGTNRGSRKRLSWCIC